MLPNNITIARACINQKWYHRLYVDREKIKDFETIEELYQYVKENYINKELEV
jgi:hypothetical protein